MSLKSAAIALHRLAWNGAPFTADDLHSSLGRVREPRHLGGLMLSAKRQGIIKPTGRWVTSFRTACHGRPVREWVGCGCA